MTDFRADDGRERVQDADKRENGVFGKESARSGARMR